MVFTEEELETISQETQILVQKLEEAKTLGRKAGAARKSTQTIFNSDVQVDSWRFNEWDYGGKCYLPSQARGLFTRLNPITDKYEIVVRLMTSFSMLVKTKACQETRYPRIYTDPSRSPPNQMVALF
ncbi:unnamed protein product [[Candida] boidinii]|nr:unnamed protein product [[Candida] boidinii]